MSALITVSALPRAILHIDGDAFFASCEQARNPALRGKPVITGKERGIAASMSYEAKARGVTRAMRYSEIKKLCPDAIFLPSDYETYSLLSERLYTIVRRYTSDVEEYGIDECFADLTGLRSVFHASYEQIADNIRSALEKELGFTFSIGLASTKVLAKVGSKWKKPNGLTVIPGRAIHLFLEKLPVEKIWGIGPATTAFLAKHQIFTALQFALQKEAWIKHYTAKPYYEIWQELNGHSVLPLHLEAKTSYASVQKTKTFTPPSNDTNFVFSQLSKNVENACIKVRRYSLAAQEAYIFLKTQDFNYFGLEIKFIRPTNIPTEMMPVIQEAFAKLFSVRKLYRATGVFFTSLKPHVVQPDLFGGTLKAEKFGKVYASTDKLASKYGKHTVFLGTSWQAQKFGAHLTERGESPKRHTEMLLGESKRRRLGIPMWLGTVS